jgi:hypothetical protein
LPASVRPSTRSKGNSHHEQRLEGENHMNARHSTESGEHYTPALIVEAARHTLEAIDLDPCSCEVANRVVRAAKYYTKEVNGFLQPWSGRVFLNPVGGWNDNLGRQVIKASKRKGVEIPGCTVTGDCGLPPGHKHRDVDSSQKRWWQELVVQWAAGDVTAAIFVCFSIELLQSTQVDQQGPIPLDFPICYPATRVSYIKPDGTVGGSPPHASCIICVSNELDMVTRFKQAYSPMGRVVVPQ